MVQKLLYRNGPVLIYKRLVVKIRAMVILHPFISQYNLEIDTYYALQLTKLPPFVPV